MLRVESLVAGYGRITCLHEVSLEVGAGEIVALLGANGAGKSTTLKAISGLLPIRAGRVVFEGETLNSVPAHQMARRGISHVPEGRRILARLTVDENLELGAYARSDRKAIRQDRDRVFGLFPVLAERRRQLAGTLSGGEQQMLAMGRGLMARPRLLLLDEPSLGLAPRLVEAVFSTIRRINQEGVALLLVEQNAYQALRVAHRGYVLDAGRITLADTAEHLADNPSVRSAYLGG
ncbi:MAG: ABC transporter ATP-binding protein [Candidatus Omnitrophica bacterium]|nr:ABC transporter ATP-binding protein [Candidatus Omnitrophota bacterium]